jgi:hypothetical protein
MRARMRSAWSGGADRTLLGNRAAARAARARWHRLVFFVPPRAPCLTPPQRCSRVAWHTRPERQSAPPVMSALALAEPASAKRRRRGDAPAASKQGEGEVAVGGSGSSSAAASGSASRSASSPAPTSDAAAPTRLESLGGALTRALIGTLAFVFRAPVRLFRPVKRECLPD